MNLPPIGYALKQADEAISAYSNQQLQTVGLNRLQWQVLNVISDTPGIDVDAIAERMSAFIDKQAVNDLMQTFQDQGLLEKSGEGITLSETGKAKLEEAGKIQGGVRQALMADIAEADYMTTIQTLQKIASNLGHEPLS